MKKVRALMKHIIAFLSSEAKAKTVAIKDKTNAFKTRLLMLSLVKHKRLGFRSIYNKIHNLLGHADPDRGYEHTQDQDKSKAIIIYNSAASTVEAYNFHEDESDSYPDLRHSLFEGEENFGDLEEGEGDSVIDLVRNSKEGGSFKLEDEIDHVADLFISRFHKHEASKTIVLQEVPRNASPSYLNPTYGHIGY